MNAIWHEIRQALGQLRHNPAFTALTVALLASLIPALRAMRVNPMEALRYE